jgi:LPS sulfotransferase NodH
LKELFNAAKHKYFKIERSTMTHSKASSPNSKTADIMSLIRSYVKRYAMITNTLNGHTKYTRFIILGRSRTGSNLLRHLLNEHSQVKVYSELFRNENEIDWGFPEISGWNGSLSLYQKDPVKFLEKKVFGKYPRSISAVGFKLFYYHAQTGQLKTLWDYFKDRTEIRIVHLKRKNILRTHLSRKKADITGAWANISGQPDEQVQFTIDYEECRLDFERTRAWEQDYDSFFQNHPKIEVIYEQLAQDYQSEIGRVQEFLGLPLEPLAPKTYKQAQLPLSESIYNFLELKGKFVGTPWEDFFEND